LTRSRPALARNVGRSASPREAPDSSSSHLRLISGGVIAGDTRSRARAASRLASVRTRTAILFLVGVLCAIGLVMVLSASAFTSLQYYGSVWTIFERQVLWMGVGVIALFLSSRMPFERWRQLRVVLLLGTLVLLVAVLAPGVGVESGGSSRWIGVGLLRIQPSEFMKLALVVFGADLVARRFDRVHETGAVAFPLVLVTAFAGVLLLAQPDMGTALVLACICFALVYAGGVPMRTLGRLLAGTGAVALLVALVEPYRRARLLSFLHPLAQRNGSGYQVVQSLVGLGNGHIYGLGLGNGRQKWGLLPNPHTDFIFSVIGEETGLVGTLIVLGLFVALAFYGLRAATRAPDRFSSLLAVGATAWITFQAVINIGAVIGVLPVTGIPLPFISFGGSSLVITMVAAGILANVAGRERAPRPVLAGGAGPSVPRGRGM
jgi:cell division protein FtsW